MHELPTPIRITTKRFELQGIPVGTIGELTHIYAEDQWELCFENEHGITYAIILAESNDFVRIMPFEAD
ncbi:MAG TPA: hypothetical protein DEF47_03390 [Herpetosiphon sp.]|uniref:hypothetical protein n=1 Tax=Herpetosiphon sp. TaxID=71864 RepID=UPI0002EA64E0|nr:hypothetical protein [Herpetosiphon sp.]HBW48936.1 hypothetical protein [Herpetosiphon sp.]